MWGCFLESFSQCLPVELPILLPIGVGFELDFDLPLAALTRSCRLLSLTIKYYYK
jgi:hypothetical protein